MLKVVPESRAIIIVYVNKRLNVIIVQAVTPTFLDGCGKMFPLF